MRCFYVRRYSSGKLGDKMCKKEATYKIRTIMGWHNYCTRHANIRMSNPFAFEKVKLVFKDIK
jgi:hypothetical protein